MPHIIVEYPERLVNVTQMNAILRALHQSITESDLYEEKHIKTRAYPFRVFTQAGGSEPYIHIQARIKSGRDGENKKRLSETILGGLQRANQVKLAVSVEIVDMDRDSYRSMGSE